MALKCVFRFEALDSTKSLNQRAELLFKKGIYFGGKVTTDTSNITNVITISPFRLISYDGMYVLSDSNINLTLEIGDFYIVCRAKYIIDDSPDVSVLAILKETFNDLPIEEKQNYVIFALVTSSASGITKINEKEYREEISQLGRNTNKGYFENEEDLLQVDALEGDFATVKSSNNAEVILYTYNGERWVAFLNSRGTEIDLLSHKLNNDIDVVHGIGVLPSEITEQNGDKGALHVTINQLNSLEKLNKVSAQQVQVPIITIGELQIIELDYGNDCISSYTITPSFIEVNSRNEVTLGKFYVDTLNGLLYIFGANNTSVTFTYSYNYLKKEVITDNEVYKIPRQNELKALKGNEYSINISEQYPSNSNKFITSKSPVPKRISANWDVKTYNNETYLVSPNRETIFVGTDSNEYIKFFEVLSLGDNSLPIALDSVHMARFENNTIVSINSITDTNGWVEQNDTPSYYERIALKIKPYSEFVAQSISSIRCTVSYHKMEGLGEISTPNGIEYLANTIYKNNYREFNTVKVDCLFGFKINSGANEIAYFKPNEIGIKGNDGISDGYGIKIIKNRISFQHTNNDIAYFEQEIGTKNKLKLNLINANLEVTASSGDISIKPSTTNGALRLFNSGSYNQSQKGIYIGDGDREVVIKGINNTSITLDNLNNSNPHSHINITTKKRESAILELYAVDDADNSNYSKIGLYESTDNTIEIKTNSSTKSTKVSISNGAKSSIVVEKNISQSTDEISLESKTSALEYSLVKINTAKAYLEVKGPETINTRYSRVELDESSINLRVFTNNDSVVNSKIALLDNQVVLEGTKTDGFAIEIKDTSSSNNNSGILIGKYYSNAWTSLILLDNTKVSLEKSFNKVQVLDNGVSLLYSNNNDKVSSIDLLTISNNYQVKISSSIESGANRTESNTYFAPEEIKLNVLSNSNLNAELKVTSTNIRATFTGTGTSVIYEDGNSAFISFAKEASETIDNVSVEVEKQKLINSDNTEILIQAKKIKKSDSSILANSYISVKEDNVLISHGGSDITIGDSITLNGNQGVTLVSANDIALANTGNHSITLNSQTISLIGGLYKGNIGPSNIKLYYNDQYLPNYIEILSAGAGIVLNSESIISTTNNTSSRMSMSNNGSLSIKTESAYNITGNNDAYSRIDMNLGNFTIESGTKSSAEQTPSNYSLGYIESKTENSSRYIAIGVNEKNTGKTRITIAYSSTAPVSLGSRSVLTYNGLTFMIGNTAYYIPLVLAT